MSQVHPVSLETEVPRGLLALGLKDLLERKVFRVCLEDLEVLERQVLKANRG